MPRLNEPLLLPLAAILSGILLGHTLQFSRPEAAWPGVAFVLLAFFSKRWLRRICVGFALLFLGVCTETWHRAGPRPEIDAGSREIVLLSGCVVEPSVLSPTREQFTLELDPGARARVTLGIDDDHAPQRLEYGQRIEIEARVRSPRNFNNPGAFDYAGYLARQHIFWTATMARGSVARVLAGRCGSRFMAAIFRIRGAALDRIESLYPGDEYTSGMMEGILIGETSKLEKIWTENFRRTGTFHALVISGAHVAVLAGVLLFLLRLCGCAEIPALTAAAGAAWLYALVSGFTPPVARAAGGFTLYLIARFFFRRGRVLNLLAAVATVYVLLDPGALFDASFQLSFLCVAVLGALSAPLLAAGPLPLARGLRDISNLDADPHLEPRVAQFRVELRLLAETASLWTRSAVRWWQEAAAWILRGGFFAFEMAIVSLAIQIGLALPMDLYFHRFSFTGITANLMIVPMLEAAVPIGFLAIFTGGRIPAVISGWLLHGSARIADWHVRWEPAWRLSNPPWLLAVAFAAALVLFALSLRFHRWRFTAGLAVAALFGVLLWQPWRADTTPGTLELTAIDVGQGDSLLVVFPDGRRMVIDGGGVLQFGPARKRRSNLDTGEDVVSPYLWSRGIQTIDILVATHAHEDHSGGLLAILDNFRPREIWVGANPPAALLERAAQRKIPVMARHAGSPFDLGGAKLEILSPPADYFSTKPGNNDSLAFRIAYGSNSFLLTGDLEAVMERRLLDDGRLTHSDLLKVGHHGSKTSTSPDFLAAVSPEFAIISAGFENSFGHPHPSVVARLVGEHAAILRTDHDGLVTVRSDGKNIVDTPKDFRHTQFMEAKPKTLMAAIKHYADADKALAEVADSRWANGVTCQHCGAEKPMFLKTRRIWKCSKCRKQFSIKTKSVFEDSPIPLDKWLTATWMIANCKNGISSYEIMRACGVTQKTAWFMLHRIRLAMQDGNAGGKIGGPGSNVEIDETFIGGKARNMHPAKRTKALEGYKSGATGKAIVHGMLERGGQVRAKVVPQANFANLMPNIMDNVELGSHLITDEATAYKKVGNYFYHEVINHLETYVRGNVHTNGIENFWSLLKRGLSGTYVSVEPFHLFRYVDEQAFRYNNRKDADGEKLTDFDRFKALLSGIVGKRLTYDQLIGSGKEAETETR